MVAGWRAMYFSYQLGEITPPGMADVEVSTWIWKAPIPVSCALGLVVVLIDLYREATAPWRITVTDYEPGAPAVKQASEILGDESVATRDPERTENSTASDNAPVGGTR